LLSSSALLFTDDLTAAGRFSFLISFLGDRLAGAALAGDYKRALTAPLFGGVSSIYLLLDFSALTLALACGLDKVTCCACFTGRTF
jgi:hypothetical protein